MKQEFKRSPVMPTLFLLPAVLFGVTFFLQISMGNPVAFLTLIASILFFVNAIWSFSTPLVTIDGNTLFYKEALLRQNQFQISDIASIDFSSGNTVDLLLKNTTKVRIRLNSMISDDREGFVKTIKSITDKQ
ncbi:MAG: hypothetical protein KKD31_16095 [Bacteroidetes bacterium]|nr:hypothetical protein [Bacteroidota bacterium]